MQSEQVDARLFWKSSLFRQMLKSILVLLSPWDFQELQSAFQRTFALFFPGGSVSKESTSNAGDHLQCRRPGFDHWLGKISWRRKWQPTLVFLSGKSPVVGGAWWATVHRVAESGKWLSTWAHKHILPSRVSLLRNGDLGCLVGLLNVYSSGQHSFRFGASLILENINFGF